MTDIGAPPGPSGSRQYPRAPIVEAVLEMRVVTPEDVTVEHLAGVAADDSSYLEPNSFYEVQGQLNLAESGVTAEALQRHTGYQRQSRDGARHFQARKDAFAYLQRSPYSDWESFVGEAERLWHAYKSVARPVALLRIGSRFVNRIDIPGSSVELKDYFRTTAEVSPDLPQAISGLLLQIQLPEVRPGIGCNIIATLTTPAEPETVSAILDIDVFCTPDIDPSLLTFDKDVRGWLSRLRWAKNDVFEACITDQTRRLFL